MSQERWFPVGATFEKSRGANQFVVRYEACPYETEKINIKKYFFIFAPFGVLLEFQKND
jgi:hypothetical protein